MTSSAKKKLATYRTSEVHDSHADISSAKTEVSIPNLLRFRPSTTGVEYVPNGSQSQYSKGCRDSRLNAGKTALRGELIRLWSARNRAGNHATKVDAEYMEVIATKA